MKTFLKVLAGILAAALIAYGVGWGITGSYNPAEWGKNRAEQQTPAVNANLKAEIEPCSVVGPGNATCPLCGQWGYVYTTTITQTTCTTSGSYSVDCSNCGQHTETTPAYGHSYRWEQTVSPTCTTTGTERYICYSCSNVSETRTVAALGHNCAWEITTQPTADTPGVAGYVCSRCSAVTDTRTVFALPADPVKEGYHFVGWYLDEALTRPYDNSPIYEDTQLYAKFELNIYTVTFDTDGGNELAAVEVEWNTAPELSTPEKTGYNFVGWFTADGEEYDGAPITEDTTLTAHWEIKTFTVTFYVNGEVYKTVTVEYGALLGRVADMAKVFANNIISFRNANMETPDISASEMTISDDMIVLANEPTIQEKITNSRIVPIVIAVIGAALMVATAATIGVNRKKKDRR